MSIKRSKQRTFGSGHHEETPHFGFNQVEAEVEKTWEEYMAGQPDEVFISYSLQSRYHKGSFIQHSKFGKGVVTKVDASHMDVLFAEGTKKLGHGKSQT